MDRVMGINSPALESVYRKHAGQRCFILGTGPSLAHTDPSLLKGEVCIGVNFISKIPDWGNLPQHIVACEYDQITNIDTAVKVRNKSRDDKPTCWYTYFHEAGQPWENEWNFIPRQPEGTPFLGDGERLPLSNLRRIVMPMGGSALFAIATQLAAWMGFTKIYLLGCENTAQGHMYDNEARLGLPVADISKAAAVTRDRFFKAGIGLFDCTPGGTLPLTRVGLDTVLGGGH
jgi:hypothetical protein